jgi:CelD/BcsL family acetyltransferase involved in cellulose biosynthesis
VFKARTVSFLIFLVMGLFVAQWQGFNHGIAHGLAATEHVASDAKTSADLVDVAKHQDACDDQHAKHHHGHDSDGQHHCAAYDAQTLGVAMPTLPTSLPVIDKTNAAINSYLTYQASIEAYRPFDVRGPPNS